MFESYAPFIWACYGITAAVFIFLFFSASRKHREELAALRRRQQMQTENVQ